MQVRFCLDVQAPFACFTRPEMKADRVSYEAITPSAARAIFEAIYWEPAIRWQVCQIDILAPIRWINLRRNELGRKVPVRSVVRAMERGKTSVGEFINDDRHQRASLLLRDVHYRITAIVAGQNLAAVAKAREIFPRRARRGQCIYQPYLGCREFACEFHLVEPGSPFVVPDELLGEIDLGLMLHEIDFSCGEGGIAQFFQAKARDGSILVPAPPASGSSRWS